MEDREKDIRERADIRFFADGGYADEFEIKYLLSLINFLQASQKELMEAGEQVIMVNKSDDILLEEIRKWHENTHHLFSDIIGENVYYLIRMLKSKKQYIQRLKEAAEKVREEK